MEPRSACFGRHFSQIVQIFCPSECEHSVSEIDEGERLVWSVGCVLSEKDLKAAPEGQTRHAMIIGAGEVGRQLHRALSNSGWTCEFVRRNDTEVRREFVELYRFLSMSLSLSIFRVGKGL